MEADIYPLRAPDLADLIDATIGELSPFHDQFGYYAQGVSPETARLPKDWMNRVVRLQNASTNGRVAYCLDATDLFVAKACAGREKDIAFNRALLRNGIVTLGKALERAALLDEPADVARTQAWIKRLAAAG